VRIEEALPALTPSVGIVAAPLNHPLDRIVRVRPRGPGPHHVGVENAQQKISVLGVPGARFAIDNLLDFLLYFFLSVGHDLAILVAFSHSFVDHMPFAPYVAIRSMSDTQAEAKRFFVERVIERARSEGVRLFSSCSSDHRGHREA
jgi:hypothetical protein